MTSSSEPAGWILPELGPPDAAGAATAAPPTPAVAERPWSPPELRAVAPRPDPVEARAALRRTELEEAYERGLAEGLREGEARAEERVRAALEVAVRLADSLESVRADFARGCARDLHGLSLAVARKLIQREVSADPSIVRDLVSRALELLPTDTSIEVKLNPADLDALEGGLERLSGSGRTPGIRWTAEPSLERGSFLVESPLRIVDGRADVALRTLFERLGYE